MDPGTHRTHRIEASARGYTFRPITVTLAAATRSRVEFELVRVAGDDD